MVEQYSDCDFEALLNKYDYNFKRGDIVKGVVCDYESDGAVVDIGSKSTAFVPNYEVSSDKKAKVVTKKFISHIHGKNLKKLKKLMKQYQLLFLK